MNEFIRPCFSELMDLAHKHGAFTEMHDCGFIEDFLPDLIDAGLDAIQKLRTGGWGGYCTGKGKSWRQIDIDWRI